MKTIPYTYNIPRLGQPPVIDARLEKEQWDCVPVMQLVNFMGQKPLHFPKTEARVAYCGHDITVIFRVEDRYVRAAETQNRGRIWEDSCVEFFITPSEDISTGYFNIEMNCCGRFLCNHQIARGVNVIPMDDAGMSLFKIAHTVKGPVAEEIGTSTTWTVEYSFPVDVFLKYSSAVMPEPGVVWRANLYKCADLSSHPHWLTWAPVDSPVPDFHLPQSFGKIIFE